MNTLEVDVWTIDLTKSRALTLSPDEHAKASRYRSEKLCLHWSRTHSALRQILASYLNVQPLDIAFERNAHGKPLVHGIQFNLSHAEDFAMIAVSHHSPVGIDIERFRPKVDLALLLERLGEADLPEDANELHQRWTRREAASKALGGALFDPPDPQIQFADLEAPQNHFASLAAVGAKPTPRYCGTR